MKQALFAAVAAFMFVGGSAVAADLPAKAPYYKAPVASYYNWTGCYIGAQAGAVQERASYHDLGAGTSTSYHETGFIGGGHIGCNFQSNQWVFGIEGDANGTSARADDGGFGGIIDTVKLNWTGSVRARLGVAMNNTLFYATG